MEVIIGLIVVGLVLWLWSRPAPSLRRHAQEARAANRRSRQEIIEATAEERARAAALVWEADRRYRTDETPITPPGEVTDVELILRGINPEVAASVLPLKRHSSILKRPEHISIKLNVYESEDVDVAVEAGLVVHCEPWVREIVELHKADLVAKRADKERIEAIDRRQAEAREAQIRERVSKLKSGDQPKNQQ